MTLADAFQVTDEAQLQAIIYSRKSPVNARAASKKEGRSVLEQDAESRAHCAALGAEIVEVFSDEVSASFAATAPRPGWEKTLAAIAARRGNLLVLWEPSRGDRIVDTWAKAVTLCGKLRVSIYVTSHTRMYRPWEARDRRSLLEDGIDSEYEVRKLQTRIVRAKRANAAAGRPNSTPLYGYMRAYDHRGKLLEVIQDPAEAPVVREICRRYSLAEAIVTIVRDLDDRGVLAPQAAAAAREMDTCEDPDRRAELQERITRVKWTTIQVRRMVSNPAYLGKMVYQGHVVGDAIWPPLIDEHLFLACRAVTEDRQATFPNNGPAREGAVKYLLSGVAVCGVCDGPLVSGGYGQQSMSYICMQRPGKPGSHAARSMSRLDEYLTEAILARLAQPDILALVTDQDGKREADAFLASAAEKEARLKAAAESHATIGTPSLEMFTVMERQLKPAIDADRAAARRIIAAASPLLAGILDDPANIRKAWETLTLAQQRTLIRLLTKRVALYPAGKVTGRPLRETVVIEWAGEEETT